MLDTRNLPEPDGNAPLGARENPWHQSRLMRVHVDNRFWAGQQQVWARTVKGSAVHEAVADHWRWVQKADDPELQRLAAQPIGIYWTDAVHEQTESGYSLRYFQKQDGRSEEKRRLEIIDEFEKQTNKIRTTTLRDLLPDELPEEVTGVKGATRELVRIDVVAVEQSFLFQDESTKDWFEGTIDLVLMLHFDNGSHGYWLVDWKTGKPTRTEGYQSPQIDTYAMALLHGVFADPPRCHGRHQLDWSHLGENDEKPHDWTGAGELVRYEAWPLGATIAVVSEKGRSVRRWFSYGKSIQRDRCEGYVRDLCRRYRLKYPDECRDKRCNQFDWSGWAGGEQ